MSAVRSTGACSEVTAISGDPPRHGARRRSPRRDRSRTASRAGGGGSGLSSGCPEDRWHRRPAPRGCCEHHAEGPGDKVARAVLRKDQLASPWSGSRRPPRALRPRRRATAGSRGSCGRAGCSTCSRRITEICAEGWSDPAQRGQRVSASIVIVEQRDDRADRLNRLAAVLDGSGLTMRREAAFFRAPAVPGGVASGRR